MGSSHFYLLALTAVMLFSTPPAMALNGIRQIPYPQAVAVTRQAVEAVITRAGIERCLRGKLTNALIDLTMSCSATGSSSSLCKLAAQIASKEEYYSLAYMIAIAETLRSMLAIDSFEP